MQWIKDKVDQARHPKDGEKHNFIIGTGAGGAQPSPTNPMAPAAPSAEAGDRAVESGYGQQQQAGGERNPYLVLPSGAEDRKRPKDGGGGGGNNASGVFYPDVYADGGKQVGEAGDEGDRYEELLTGEQILVTIPGSVVHLVDDQESVHLASGKFSLVRFVQDRTRIVVIAKVGESLKWPLVQEEPTVKLDETHYFFTLKVPKEFAQEGFDPASAAGIGDASGVLTLNYGVTFPAQGDEGQGARIRDLDYFLGRYSLFSSPQILQGEAAKPDEEALEKGTAREGSQSGAVPAAASRVSEDGTLVADEETSAAFWTTVAPNVDDYNSRLAKWIATGAGHVIKNIFWVSDATAARLDSSGGYWKEKYQPNEKKSNVSPTAIAGVRSVRKISQMTDKVAGGILGGILYTTGLVAKAVVKSPPGKLFFKTTPGEVALVSLDAFGTVFDAIEKAGRNVLGRSSAVTQDVVNHRYGESAQQLTDESFRSVGHAFSTVWNVVKIQKAFNPRAVASKARVAKTVGKHAVNVNKENAKQSREAASQLDDTAPTGTADKLEAAKQA